MDSECSVHTDANFERSVLVNAQEVDRERVVEICGVLIAAKLPPWTTTNQ